MLLPILLVVSLAGLIFCGLLNLVHLLLQYPDSREWRTVRSVIRSTSKKEPPADRIIQSMSSALAPYMFVEAYQSRKLQSTLHAAGIQSTPQLFLAEVWVKTLLLLMMFSPIALILPMAIPFLVILTISLYFKEVSRPDSVLKERRAAIETDLPRMVMTIEQELGATRDVLGILSNFRRNTTPALRRELDITVADMRTGNLETALTRLGARVGSPKLTDVVRGLLSVVRGDDGQVYFKILAHDFKLMEVQRLKLEAMKKPDRIRRCSMFCTFAFLALCLMAMGIEIFQSLGNLF